MSLGPAIGLVARRMGKPLMLWQQLVADVGGELVESEDGLLVPAYREVVFTTPRQNGKTSLVLPWECERAIGRFSVEDGAQRIAYSAQTAKDAEEKLLLDQAPILMKHKKALLVDAVQKSNGKAGVSWANGSRLVLLASTEDAGHGKTIDLGVKDELFADEDDRRDQALGPSMITKDRAQILTCSTMGTEASLPWNRLVERGRRAVESGKREGTAYFEWSAPDDADPDDPATWMACMPAYGVTIREPAVRLERERQPDNGFRRAYLNQQTRADDRVIPGPVWDLVCTTGRELGADEPVVLAVDVNEPRSAACIAASSKVGTPVIEIVDHRQTGNVAWVVDRIADIAARNQNAPVVVAKNAPAGSLIPEFERRGVRVLPAAPRDEVDASGSFFDAVIDQHVWVRRHGALDAAVAAASKRHIGDAWVWNRKAQADMTPLIAATLARWAAGGGSKMAGPSTYEERGLVVL